MERLIAGLIGVLQHSQQRYEGLLTVIRNEQDAALASDVEQMVLIGAEKANLLAQLRHLDQQRDRLLHQIAAQLQLPIQQLTLTTLALHTQNTHGVQLKQLHSALGMLVAKIRKANQESRMLIQHCLGLVHNALSFLNHWIGATEVYGASGQMRADAHGGRLLSGVV